MTPDDPALAAEHLSATRDGVTVLDDITLRIPRGAMVGLVGRNGAGKSTMMRCLLGLSQPSAGAAFVLGSPSLKLGDAVRERIGYVAQTPDLFGGMDGIEHLRAIGRAYPRWDERRALVLATRLDLPLGRRADKLSAGDQQKLAVVLALAHDPELLVLDEPVASLDPVTRREFIRTLFDTRENGGERTVLLSSHLLADLERVVTHVAFIRAGRLQLFAPWDTLLENLRLLTPEASAMQDLPGAARVHTGREGACLIDLRQAPQLADLCRSLSLDELFVELHS